MRFEYSRDQFDDASAIFSRAFSRSIVLDALNQVIDRSNMPSFVGAVCPYFGCAYTSRSNRLPGLTRSSWRPTAISQEIRFCEITTLHFDDSLRPENLNCEPPGIASHISSRCEVAIGAAGK